MSIFKKLTNFLMPEDDYDEYDEYEEEEEESAVAIKEDRLARSRSIGVAQSKAGEMRSVAGGSPIFVAPPPPLSRRPELTVHTNPSFAKGSDLKVSIFTPAKYDDVSMIADVLKANRAAIVNFERSATHERQRIFDFLNGACYVLGGDVCLVGNDIVLYAPAQVKIEDKR